jgi:hypothetical protein
MSKRYKRQSLNHLSSLFHHEIIRIIFLSHLSQIGDTWESFLILNNFSQPERKVNPPLNENPNNDDPMTENQVFNSHEGYGINELSLVYFQTPLAKKLRGIFSPRNFVE